MTLVVVSGRSVDVELLDLELGGALVDEALVALGAGDGHLLAVVQQLAWRCRCRRSPAGRARG